MNAIRKRAREFLAVLALVVIAAVVGGYILVNQRFTLPGWVPVLGTEVFKLKAQFSTAQAVTPGQGQTVNVAGVKVGEISDVELVDGRAVVSMNLEPKYDTVYPDAHVLLRPKTGLKDMIVEMDPGTPKSGPKLKQGATLPVQNSLPDVNVDEILASLDTDTRAYLRLLLGGAGEGLRGNEDDLQATLRRLEPTARDLEKITGELRKRQANIRRGVNNFQLLATALGDKDTDLGNLVNSSNAVFQSFASQDANIRRTLQLLPETLQITQTNLGKVDQLANALGPTLQSLRPAARNLGPSLEQARPFLRESTPIIRDQIRPFTRASLPLVRKLRPTAANLTEVTPDLTSSLETLSYVLNELTYNPPGDQDEGYFFWFLWANHAATTVFSTQDAHGPIRRGTLLVSCTTAQVLQGVGAVNAGLKALGDLTAPPNPQQACPGGATGPTPIPVGTQLSEAIPNVPPATTTTEGATPTETPASEPTP